MYVRTYSTATVQAHTDWSPRDIGGPNMITDFAVSWYSRAATEGRQVIMDSRCSLPGDFDTPEYARHGAVY
jgi:alpha-L-fucosidase